MRRAGRPGRHQAGVPGSHAEGDGRRGRLGVGRGSQPRPASGLGEQARAVRRRAPRRAVPGIVADLQRAIAATSNPTTIAAAEYNIAMSWYQLDVDLDKALEHFRIVVEKHPNYTYADSAREHVREIETLGSGRPAPD